MVEYISHKLVKARKDYVCNSYQFLSDELEYNDRFINKLTYSEKRAVVKARKSKGVINKGEIYERYTGRYEGSIFSVPSIPEIAAICTKYDLYSDN